MKKVRRRSIVYTVTWSGYDFLSSVNPAISISIIGTNIDKGKFTSMVLKDSGPLLKNG